MPAAASAMFETFTVPGRKITNIYRQVTEECTLLTIMNDLGTYNFTAVVDTRMVHELRHFAWWKIKTQSGNYIGTRVNDSTKRHLESIHLADKVTDPLLLHRFIAYVENIPNPDPENATYVDHISRQTLDNRVKNLRWATQSLQNINRDKKNRQCIARPLPTDIKIKQLPKYVTWNMYDGAGFFRIECHPALKIQKKKCINSQKSKSVCNQVKLEQILAKLAELDKLVDTDPEKDAREALLAEYTTVSGL
jgi:hypothetical protein